MKKIDKNGLLFWNVDTQFDFVMPDGDLYVKDAEKIRPLWQEITDYAEKNNIQVVSSADYHNDKTVEINENPDFVKTFPSHCIGGTAGAEFIKETAPTSPIIFNWNEDYNNEPIFLTAKKSRNIVIRKDQFDVFAGNPYTDRIVSELQPKTVVVYGVTTNVCVDTAVMGLAQRVKNVWVLEDAIKELPNIPLPFEAWKKVGVKLITFNELKKLID